MAKPSSKCENNNFQISSDSKFTFFIPIPKEITGIPHFIVLHFLLCFSDTAFFTNWKCVATLSQEGLSGSH